MKTASYSLLLIGILLTASQALAWDNICELGHNALSLTSVQLPDYYKDNLKGRLFEGKGFVRNVRQQGINKQYIVAVDCGNDVIVNVFTSANCKDLNAGTVVSFDGHCIGFNRWPYTDTKQPYMIFDLERGSVAVK